MAFSGPTCGMLNKANHAPEVRCAVYDRRLTLLTMCPVGCCGAHRALHAPRCKLPLCAQACSLRAAAFPTIDGMHA